MRITLVAPSLRCGGTEKILALLANQWAAQGRDVTVVVMDHTENRPFYQLLASIKLLPLGLLSDSASWWTGLRHNLQRIGILRHALLSSRPQVIISFLTKTNIRVLLATIGSRLPVIICERSDPWRAPLPLPWCLLRNVTYPLATHLTVVTQKAAEYFRGRQNVHVIPNPVPRVNRPATPALDAQRLVALGRLEYVKGFDLLVRAFAIVQQQVPEATLTIWGEGSQRRTLEALCEEFQIASQVRLPGLTQNAMQALSEASLFVQSSRWEGFPNALCEAMSLGLPVIATNCGGAPEIVREGIDGVLVPGENSDALAQAILSLLRDATRRRDLATRAQEITRRFCLENVMQQWETLLAEACA